MVVYATVAEVSIGKLFIAGIVPGLMLTIAMMATVQLLALRRGWLPSHPRLRLSDFLERLREAAPAFLYPVIFIVGIRLGLLTVTEAAGVAVLYTVFLGTVVYKEMRFSHLPAMALRAGMQTGVVMLIIGVMAPLAWLLAVERVAEAIGHSLAGVAGPVVFLLVVNLILLVFGMLMDSLATIILLTPILAPIAAILGIDPTHFGMVVVLNLVIGTITPPVGGTVFIVSVVGKIPAEDIFSEVLRFLPGLLAVLLIVTYVPESFLWLVSLIGPRPFQ
jgi:tripartite ATP-independent transporter DctM subunit